MSLAERYVSYSTYIIDVRLNFLPSHHKYFVTMRARHPISFGGTSISHIPYSHETAIFSMSVGHGPFLVSFCTTHNMHTKDLIVSVAC